MSALGYFTIIPAGSATSGAAPDAYAISYLPLIGAIVGAISGAVAWGLSLIAPHAFVVCAAFALPVLLTGAIHVDGFLDSCDALFVTASAQRRLEIFKDPRHGTFAIAGMAILCAVWLSALWRFMPWQYPLVLAFVGGTARLSAVANAFFIPYARGGEVTRAFESRPSAIVLAFWLMLFLGMSYFLWVWAWGLLLLAVAFNLFAGFRLARRLDGGLVGDVYGYLIVTTEVSMLAVLCVHA